MLGLYGVRRLVTSAQRGGSLKPLNIVRCFPKIWGDKGKTIAQPTIPSLITGLIFVNTEMLSCEVVAQSLKCILLE